MRHVNWVRLSIIVLLPAVLGLGNVVLNPNRPAWSEGALLEGELSLSGALSGTEKVLWIDARSAAEFASAKIPGAILLNEDQWGDLLPDFLSAWQPSMRVVVYCSSKKCHSSNEVAKRLRSEVGIVNVFVLKGGWEEWLTRKE